MGYIVCFAIFIGYLLLSLWGAVVCSRDTTYEEIRRRAKRKPPEGAA